MAEQSGPAGRLPSGISERERERLQLVAAAGSLRNNCPLRALAAAGETLFARVDAAAAAREEACPGMCGD